MKIKRIFAGAMAAAIAAVSFSVLDISVMAEDIVDNTGDSDIVITAPVTIDETNFPDEVFRNYISRTFDVLPLYYDIDGNLIKRGGDGKLNYDEIRNIKEINIYGLTVGGEKQYVTDMTGIEKFPCLEILNCNGNKLSALNVTKNYRLKYLYVNDNELRCLDLRSNAKLLQLSCSRNHLTSLLLDNNDLLTSVVCEGNTFTYVIPPDTNEEINMSELPYENAPNLIDSYVSDVTGATFTADGQLKDFESEIVTYNYNTNGWVLPFTLLVSEYDPYRGEVTVWKNGKDKKPDKNFLGEFYATQPIQHGMTSVDGKWELVVTPVECDTVDELKEYFTETGRLSILGKQKTTEAKKIASAKIKNNTGIITVKGGSEPGAVNIWIAEFKDKKMVDGPVTIFGKEEDGSDKTIMIRPYYYRATNKCAPSGIVVSDHKPGRTNDGSEYRKVLSTPLKQIGIYDDEFLPGPFYIADKKLNISVDCRFSVTIDDPSVAELFYDESTKSFLLSPKKTDEIKKTFITVVNYESSKKTKVNVVVYPSE